MKAANVTPAVSVRSLRHAVSRGVKKDAAQLGLALAAAVAVFLVGTYLLASVGSGTGESTLDWPRWPVLLAAIAMAVLALCVLCALGVLLQHGRHVAPAEWHRSRRFARPAKPAFGLRALARPRRARSVVSAPAAD